MFALGLVLLAGNQAKSQGTSGESAIRNLPREFFSAVKAKDTQVIQDSFHADAVVNTTLDAGIFATLGPANVADFLTRVGTSEAVLDEEILSIETRIDGHMAHGWTPYKFNMGGNFSPCGVN